MNLELLKERLPFLQALADGKTVQTKSQWGRYPSTLGVEYMAVTAEYIVTAPSDVKFRIKPEPREWWIIEKTGTRVVCTKEDVSRANYGLPCDWTSILVREVLPD